MGTQTYSVSQQSSSVVAGAVTDAVDGVVCVEQDVGTSAGVRGGDDD